ncbi:MAG: ribosome maturation factor RimP [Thiotrichaceae bacterium]
MIDNKLQELLAPAITALGYELLGIERITQGKRGTLLRVFIDCDEGITLDDCERVSHQVSGILDVEDPIVGKYVLEVSSPGLDRPLFTLDHFSRFVGHKISVKLRRPLDTRRNFSGVLQRVDNNKIFILVDQTEFALPYEQVERAHLVADF